MDATILLDVHDVRRTFPKPGGDELLVLEGVNLTCERARSSACSAAPARENPRCCG